MPARLRVPGVTDQALRDELLEALCEIVEAAELRSEPGDAFRRILELALAATSAEGGSLMLLAPGDDALTLSTAVGVEPAVWPAVRVPLGEGIAGVAAADGSPLLVRGAADPRHFRIVWERHDRAAALSVPLVYEGRVLGVVNLHHGTHEAHFDAGALAFAERFAALAARLVANAATQRALREDAARYRALHDVQLAFEAAGPLDARIANACEAVARHAGNGFATLHLQRRAGNRLERVVWPPPSDASGAQLASPHSLVSRVAKARTPLFLRDPSGTLAEAVLPLPGGDGRPGDEALPADEAALPEDDRAALGERPLQEERALSGERTLRGVLTVQLGSSECDAPDPTVLLLELAAWLASALARDARASADDAETLRTLEIADASAALLDETDVGALAQRAAAVARELLCASHAIVRLRDETTGRAVVRAYAGDADGVPREQLFRLDRTLTEAARERQAPWLPADPDRDETDPRTPFTAVVAPLRIAGRGVGTLSLYGRDEEGGGFDETDLAALTRLARHTERALHTALLESRARQQRHVDTRTGLPTFSYLRTRIDQEIARAASGHTGLVLVTCRVENLDTLREAVSSEHADRVIQLVAQALAAHVHPYEVMARTAEDAFAALLPEPGTPPRDRVAELATAVADHVAKDEELNEPLRVALCFGYALHPSEAPDREALVARAEQPRIRVL